VARALLERYQALLESGRRPVIVAIDRGTCAGCHLRLPTMVESRSRRLPGIYACPQCRRMLYPPELLGAEDPNGLGSQAKRVSRRAPRGSKPERS
jgi:hypothetical protein